MDDEVAVLGGFEESHEGPQRVELRLQRRDVHPTVVGPRLLPWILSQQVSKPLDILFGVDVAYQHAAIAAVLALMWATGSQMNAPCRSTDMLRIRLYVFEPVALERRRY